MSLRPSTLKKAVAACTCSGMILGSSSMALASSELTTLSKIAKMTDLLAEKTDGNLVLSPYSIRVALAMLAQGAVGNTLTELDAFLGSDAMDPSHWMQVLSPSEEETTLSSANALWTNLDFDVNPEYVKNLQTYFAAHAESLDFSDPAAPDLINQWVSEQTNGLINDLADESISGMSAILMNALYYNGTWVDPFDDSAVTNEVFHSPSGDQEANMLNGRGSGFQYYETAEACGFSLDYMDGRKFVAILPNDESFTFSDLDLDAFLASQADWAEQNVALTYKLPEFKNSAAASLKDVLSELGVTDVFTTKAQLLGIAPDLAVSDILHKAYIDVNRSGTEAAAVTEIMVKSAAIIPMSDDIIMKEVILDRPFAYMILDPATDEVLFLGKVNSLS